jgi:hypothetical protein
MRTIYKYPVQPLAEFEIALPMGAEVLTVQMQNGKPYIWALVDTNLVSHQRTFYLRGTGHRCSDLQVNGVRVAGRVPVRYVGTFQMDDGASVFHLFERQEFR